MRMLAELAKLTALDEGSAQSFKARAYQRAMAGIEAHPGELGGLTKRDLVEISGVGDATASKLLEFEATGQVAKLESLRGKYPAPFVELTKIPGLGPKTLKTLRDRFGVEDIDSLMDAISSKRLREAPGMGEKTEEKIARAVERLGLDSEERRTPLAEAHGLAWAIARRLSEVEGVVEAVPCGSIRRFAETVGDVVIVVAATSPAAVHEAAAALPEAAEAIGSEKAKTSFVTRAGLQVDIRVAPPEQLGAALLRFTGPTDHHAALRQRAVDRGLTLSERGLLDGDRVLASKTEDAIYEALGLPFAPPTLREGPDAASESDWPDLITRDRIKGDLHYHSDRSGDGRSTLEQMARAAVEAGYSYVAFTEHGEDLAINGSSREEMAAHRDRIRRLDAEMEEITLLHGCELNIGPDGSLDYDPEFRLGFDWCVASIHSHFDLPEERQTARILTALQDPAVNAVGHLTGRYVGRRPGVDLDIDAVLEGLAVAGVALEVNGALDRLDASSETAGAAVERGIDVSIATDSHHVSDLVRMGYGVRYAQRGRVPADRVLNARPVEEVLARAAARRG